MIPELPDDWKIELSEVINSTLYQQIISQVNEAFIKQKTYPPSEKIFEAFALCSFSSVKVVLLGQDPYHRENQAHGLSFSVNAGIKHPPSLKNIFKELCSDVDGFAVPQSGDLSSWAKQGVLLLNAVLTVAEGLPGSHKSFGWEKFTDAVIQTVSDRKENVVFLLWGNYAISKAGLIDKNKHLILTAPHPSPLARGGFFGCKHFSKTNKYLQDRGLEPINWKLT